MHDIQSDITTVLNSFRISGGIVVQKGKTARSKTATLGSRNLSRAELATRHRPAARASITKIFVSI